MWFVPLENQNPNIDDSDVQTEEEFQDVREWMGFNCLTVTSEESFC